MSPKTAEAIDVAVIGAGAAGLMAAIAAAETGSRSEPPPNVTLFDSRRKIGAKILISGGTRCNVTNVDVTPADYCGGPRHFVKHVLEAFSPDQTRAFFEGIGVELVLEPTGKYFPITHSGRTVLEALTRECERQGARLVTGVKIQKIEKEKSGRYILKGKTDEGADFEAFARAVILATGGLSYPETGSDGTGYSLAKALGHSVTPTYPALTPLTTADPDWPTLSGITLEARLSFFKDGKKNAEAAGSFLFTHAGYSGPAALDISRHVAANAQAQISIEASFLPDYNEETLKAAFENFQKNHPDRLIKSFLSDRMGLPERFVELFLAKHGFDGRVSMNRLKRDERGRLIHALLHCPLAVNGVLGYKKAEVTAGGVPLDEVRVATMESRLSPGLYFAGEILDMDGRIGGFNFQWAWSTGRIAGASAAESLL